MPKPKFYGKTTACISNKKRDKRFMKKLAQQSRAKQRGGILVAAKSREKEA